MASKNLNEELRRMKKILSRIDENFTIKEGIGGIFDDIIAKVTGKSVANSLIHSSLIGELEAAGFKGVRTILELAEMAQKVYVNQADSFTMPQLKALMKV